MPNHGGEEQKLQTETSVEDVSGQSEKGSAKKGREINKKEDRDRIYQEE
jgi:hypothetical protein